MIKKLLILLIVIQNIQAQLSPVQLQKVKADFDKALKDKQFDTAQEHLKQIEQGGRRAHALELSAQLANARQKDTEEKKLAELHKGQQAEAKRVMATRETEKYKKELEEVRKELNAYKAQQPKVDGQKQFIVKDDRPNVPLSVYQKVIGKADSSATPYEILKISERATPDQIRHAWRSQIQKWHPDQNKDPETKEAYMLINWAYATLNISLPLF